MEATATPRTRKSSIAHRLGLILDALKRGDLDNHPHQQANVVKELRWAAGDLQTLAVAVLAVATEVNDSTTVFTRMRATESAVEVLGNVARDLGQ